MVLNKRLWDSYELNNPFELYILLKGFQTIELSSIANIYALL